uniref:Interleukin-11 receptor subunit alpha n=1 Tax=Chelonoidis abingdonii TaxID=106734 RepID=A0A8C0GKD9_CHEAB
MDPAPSGRGGGGTLTPQLCWYPSVPTRSPLQPQPWVPQPPALHCPSLLTRRPLRPQLCQCPSLPTCIPCYSCALTPGLLGLDVPLVPSSEVEWRRDGAAALPEGCILRDGDLLLPQAELAAGGAYSCHDRTGQLLRSIFLRLGYLPGIPSVTCRASDYENFSCSWTPSVETFLPTRYITTYRLWNSRSTPSPDPSPWVGPCVQDPGRPHTCTVPRCEFWSSYRLNVTEVNPLGSSFRLLDVTMQAIIKPDPPEGLVVEPVPSAPRRLRVRWQYPASWPKEPHFQLKFRLQYRPVVHGSWSTVETVNLSEVITDAFSGLEHVVQVGAKDFLDAGNWSEWSAEARATPGPGEEGQLGQGQVRRGDRSDPMEKVAILISLGIFAFFILVPHARGWDRPFGSTGRAGAGVLGSPSGLGHVAAVFPPPAGDAMELCPT